MAVDWPVFGSGELGVNSAHHQAAKSVGKAWS